MLCPRCVQKIHCGAETCPHCGFFLTMADATFGGEMLATGVFSDAVGLLKLAQRQKIQACINRFGLQFPQLFFAVHICSFPQKCDMREYSFWALNRCRFNDLPPQKKKNAGALLIIDANSKTAVMSYGYMLDAYLCEDDTSACLNAAYPLWADNRFSDGIIALIQHLASILARKHRQQQKKPETFVRAVMPPGEIGRASSRHGAQKQKDSREDEP